MNPHSKKIDIDQDILARSWKKIRDSMEELQSNNEFQIEETEVDNHSSIFGYISQTNTNRLNSIDDEIEMYKVKQLLIDLLTNIIILFRILWTKY